MFVKTKFFGLVGDGLIEEPLVLFKPENSTRLAELKIFLEPFLTSLTSADSFNARMTCYADGTEKNMSYVLAASFENAAERNDLQNHANEQLEIVKKNPELFLYVRVLSFCQDIASAAATGDFELGKIHVEIIRVGLDLERFRELCDALSEIFALDPNFMTNMKLHAAQLSLPFD